MASLRGSTKEVRVEAVVATPVEPLEEEEQLRVVRDLRIAGAHLDRATRIVAVLANVVLCLLCVACVACLLVRSPRAPGDYDFELAHQTFLLGSVRWSWERLLVSYASTVVVLCVGAAACLGGASTALRRCAMVMALLPAALWVPTLARLRAPLMFCWIAGVAPLALAFSLYVDKDMAKLALDITNLDSLRYKFKGV